MKVMQFVGLVTGITFLVGCKSASAVRTAMITAEPTCDTPGSILNDEIAESIRGYVYYFQVYLPPCYDLEDERQYPTIYLLPGWGGSSRDWFAAGLSEVADEMILDGEIPPFLIVATGNNDVDLLGEVVHQDLVPYVESHYRVLAERPYRAVAGGSLGGSRAYRLALHNPGT
ncbi:MAG: alpha/beta hydrolase-fold protein, partial [Candidatus Promineifilaceae bacterium]